MSWSCPRCKTTDPSLRYRQSKMRICKDCSRFQTIQGNVRHQRVHERTPKLCFTKEEFMRWVRARPRRCEYCGLAEQDVYDLDLKTQTGQRLQAIGIDRSDNGDYRLETIVLCCFPCNKARGNNVFSADEMRELVGPAVAKIWARR